MTLAPGLLVCTNKMDDSTRNQAWELERIKWAYGKIKKKISFEYVGILYLGDQEAFGCVSILHGLGVYD